MKIFVEAYSETCPPWIRNFLSEIEYRTWSASSGASRASSLRNIDASRAQFVDVSEESVTELRRRMKSGNDMLFMLEPAFSSRYDDIPIMVSADPDNKETGLRVVASTRGSSDLKHMSFKRLVDNAIEVYYTKISNDKKDLQTQRVKNRRGMIYRKGDSAQDTLDLANHFSWNGSRWVTDASGYEYDANRLSRKLAEMHEGDIGFYLSKAAKIFKTMAENYADKVKEMAEIDSNSRIDTGTFSKTGFSFIIREGERTLNDAAERINQMQEYAEDSLVSFEAANEQRTDAQLLSQQEYEDGIRRLQNRVKKEYNNIQAYRSKLNRILSGQGDD